MFLINYNMQRLILFLPVTLCFFACVKDYSCVCETVYYPIDSTGVQDTVEHTSIEKFILSGRKKDVSTECKQMSLIADSSNNLNGNIFCYLEE